MARYIGVMSGTSMDAVDCAAVDFAGSEPRLIATSHSPWPADLRERLQVFASGAPLDAAGVAVLDTEVGDFFAQVVRWTLDAHGLSAQGINAIGCHGQTVAHLPGERFATTLQLGDANRVAEITGITTINDFRRRDMAAGGQGAPLAPAFHAAVLRSTDEERVVLNLGGIANITRLPARPDAAVEGFDTGPANCLLDGWAQRQLGQAFDRDGAWAASGRVNPKLLAHLRDDPYFDLAPPKSTGTQAFSAHWLDARLAGFADCAPADVQASLLALTCSTVTDAIKTHANAAQRVLVCGGGVHNAHLMQQLANALQRPVESTTGYGIDSDWMEAMAFAWLAKRTLDSLPGNLADVTGAAGPRILGAVHPA